VRPCEESQAFSSGKEMALRKPRKMLCLLPEVAVGNHRQKVPGKSAVSSRASGRSRDITLWNTNSEIQDITDFQIVIKLSKE
jgi:hypothetical protein